MTDRQPRALSLLLAMVLLLLAGSSRAEGKQYVLWFDAQLSPHAANPKLESLSIVEGDTLVIKVDPTRLFGALPVAKNALAFGAAPPELLSFYVAATPGGAAYSRYLQPGACVLGATDVAPHPSAQICTPDSFGQWNVAVAGQRVLRCSATPVASLKALVDSHGTSWSLVHDDPAMAGTRTCLATYVMAASGQLQQVVAKVAIGGGAAETLPLTVDNGLYTVNAKLKPGVTRLVMEIARAGSPVPVTRTLSDFTVESTEEHSLVRVQAELLATNRMRTVSFAVALSPVRREFFKSGPWRNGCYAFCGFTPQALIRISGDQSTLLQIGLGLGIYITAPIQFNAGFLFGTKDASAGWSAERSAYAGFAIDPFLLAETKTTTAAGVK